MRIGDLRLPHLIPKSSGIRVIGVNPLKDSIVGARFTGQIMGISRLDVSHALLAQ